jgi:hypothetical protein
LSLFCGKRQKSVERKIAVFPLAHLSGDGLDLAVTVRIRESFSSDIAHLCTSQVLGKIDEGD